MFILNRNIHFMLECVAEILKTTKQRTLHMFMISCWYIFVLFDIRYMHSYFLWFALRLVEILKCQQNRIQRISKVLFPMNAYCTVLWRLFVHFSVEKISLYALLFILWRWWWYMRKTNQTFDVTWREKQCVG